MKDDPDRCLVERAKDGNTRAFGGLVQKYQKRVYELAYNFTRHPDDAYDLAQEISLRAFKALNRFESKSTFYTWIYRIAKNAGIDYTRRQAGHTKLSFTEELPPDDLLSQGDKDVAMRRLEQIELGQEIKKAIQHLSPRQKQVFILRHHKRLSLREIADVLQLRIGSVKAHLFSATRKLRELLTPYLED